jgi:type II secretory pathway pseudopilin PulG
MALLVILMITGVLAVGFTLITTERRTVDDQQAQVRALGIAQQGMDAYLRHPENPAFRPGRTIHLPPLNNDTAWVPVNTIDTAIVIPRLLRTSTLVSVDTMYAISSLGVQGGGLIAGTPRARRAVAEFASWSGAFVPIKAGWLSLTGIKKNGVSGTLSGNDAASPGCGGPTSLAGVSVPTNIMDNGTPQSGYNGPLNPLSGSPPLDNTSLGGTTQSAADSVAKTGIAWDRWAQGLDLPNVWRTADHGGAFPSFTDPNYYPIVYVSGDLPDLPNGRGLLIVSGALTMNGNTHWDGIVMVGGGVTANGNDNVQGAVLSGLNAMLGATSIPVASLGNGTKTIQYNSCEIQKALVGTKALVPQRGTWTDNWATY